MEKYWRDTKVVEKQGRSKGTVGYCFGSAGQVRLHETTSAATCQIGRLTKHRVEYGKEVELTDNTTRSCQTVRRIGKELAIKK